MTETISVFLQYILALFAAGEHKRWTLQYLKLTSQVPSELISSASLTTNIGAAIQCGLF